MSDAFQARSLYRSFWRGLWHVSRGDMGRLANLRRLYRPQVREALQDGAMDENTIRVNSASRVLRLRARFAPADLRSPPRPQCFARSPC